MSPTRFATFALRLWLSCLLGGACALARAQTPVPGDGNRPRVFIDFRTLDTKDLGWNESPDKRPRPPLAGMPNGLFIDPRTLENEEDGPTYDLDGNRVVAEPWDSSLQFNVGNFNPYFEMRRPGDPGGLGYTKLHSTMPFFDVGASSFSLGFQALTPTGTQAGGIQNGPTNVMPALGWFHDLGEGTALQGYVGQNIQANSRWRDNLDSGYLYSMSLQCPVPGATTPVGDQGVFVFVQALGRYRYDLGRPDSKPMLWEFVPGVHLRMNSSCWMSVGASRYNFLSCSWQY